ncbi:MAG: helix-turn-helix domain-containing protein [Hyphomicrobiaceae bacterium]
MSCRSHHAARQEQFAETPLQGSAHVSLVKSVVDGTVSRIFDVAVTDLALTRRGTAEIAFARQVAMYLTHVAGGLSLSEVGRIFNRDRTTVAYACLIIEDRRDDPRLDRALEMIEAILKRVAPPSSLELIERRRSFQQRSVA